MPNWEAFLQIKPVFITVPRELDMPEMAISLVFSFNKFSKLL